MTTQREQDIMRGVLTQLLYHMPEASQAYEDGFRWVYVDSYNNVWFMFDKFHNPPAKGMGSKLLGNLEIPRLARMSCTIQLAALININTIKSEGSTVRRPRWLTPKQPRTHDS